MLDQTHSPLAMHWTILLLLQVAVATAAAQTVHELPAFAAIAESSTWEMTRQEGGATFRRYMVVDFVLGRMRVSTESPSANLVTNLTLADGTRYCFESLSATFIGRMGTTLSSGELASATQPRTCSTRMVDTPNLDRLGVVTSLVLDHYDATRLYWKTIGSNVVALVEDRHTRRPVQLGPWSVVAYSEGADVALLAVPAICIGSPMESDERDRTLAPPQPRHQQETPTPHLHRHEQVRLMDAAPPLADIVSLDAMFREMKHHAGDTLDLSATSVADLAKWFSGHTGTSAAAASPSLQSVEGHTDAAARVKLQIRLAGTNWCGTGNDNGATDAGAGGESADVPESVYFTGGSAAVWDTGAMPILISANRHPGDGPGFPIGMSTGALPNIWTNQRVANAVPFSAANPTVPLAATNDGNDVYCRQHDRCPVFSGSETSCACDYAIRTQAASGLIKLVFSEIDYFWPCLNLERSCRAAAGLFDSVCVGGFVKRWAPQYVNKYKPGYEQGFSLWGPIAPLDPAGGLVTIMRLPGEGPAPNAAAIGDGRCDLENDIPSAGYDGGDCHPNLCRNNTHTCGSAGFTNSQPITTGEAACVRLESHDYIVGGSVVESRLGDGYCDDDLNNEANGYDPDCCSQTCISGIFVCGADTPYNCRQPGCT
jgi:hypothetical protein